MFSNESTVLFWRNQLRSLNFVIAAAAVLLVVIYPHCSLCVSNWVDLWALLSPECRDEVLKIEYEKLKEAMGVYLEKHRLVGLAHTPLLLQPSMSLGAATSLVEEFSACLSKHSDCSLLNCAVIDND